MMIIERNFDKAHFTFAGNEYIHIDIIQLSKLLNNDPTCANTNFHDLPQAIDV